MDLVCLVADRNMEAAIDSVLRRPLALGIRAVEFELVVHPERDPGCYYEPQKLLQGHVRRAEHALVVLDRAWAGAPANSGPELEELLEKSLGGLGPPGWARAVVIDPELEVWVFSDSPHVSAILGWTHDSPLREVLEQAGRWGRGHTKPEDPKSAMEWVLRTTRQPRSSALFRKLGETVSLERCQDRSFRRLVGLLRDWFGAKSVR